MSVRCAHILQKHTGSRNPVDSYRNKPVTRSLAEAKANINNFLAQVRQNPQLFSTLAKEYSECRSAAKGGDLGQFERGDMQKAFEDVSFSLKVG